ncbi:MAG: DUF4175 family protein [Candidatus Omnitrophota bacterium]
MTSYKPWLSPAHFHRLYRRNFSRRLLELILLALTGGLLGLQFLYFSAEIFRLSNLAINIVFLLIAVVFLRTLYRYVLEWASHGIRLASYFRQWEERHPEAANRSSLMIYAEKHPEEIKRLGYSSELLEADDRWLSGYLERIGQEEQKSLSIVLAIVFLAVSISSGLYYSIRGDLARERLDRIVQALYIRGTSVEPAALVTSSAVQAARGEPVMLSAVRRDGNFASSAFIHLANASGWKTYPAAVLGSRIAFSVPALHERMEYFFSAGGSISNQGFAIPLDPPVLAEGVITITPPSYTARPPEVLSGLRPISVLRNSRIVIEATATEPLQSASFLWNEESRPAEVIGKTIFAAFTADRSGEYSLQLTDEHGLSNNGRGYKLTAIPDATPEIAILQPPAVIPMPAAMKQRLQVRASDDYAVHRIYFHYAVNNNQNTAKEEFLWAYTQETAKDVGSATQFFLTFDWDMEPLMMFPGDEASYYFTAWDGDQIDGPKMGRSSTNIVRYLSLVDLLSDLDESESQQVGGLSDVVEEQKQITEDVKKTLGNVEDKIENAADNEESEKDLWMEKKDLEALKDRQEQLVEEAKKIEEELGKYQQSAEENLSPEEQKQQGFTPETLEKMTRIQDLLKELLDKDSMQVMQKLEQTVEQLSKQINAEQLQDLNFSMENFEQQLERTLNMLEDAYDVRQLEGLRQMTEELAQRQEHLKRETEEIAQAKQSLDDQIAQAEKEAENAAKTGENASEKSPDEGKKEGDESAKSDEAAQKLEELKAQKKELENQESMLAERQRNLEKDANEMMQKMQGMQKNLQEKNPVISQKLQEMAEKAMAQNLQNELAQATQKLQQGQSQQAQPHQQNAQNQLQEMAQELQDNSFDLGGMNMQMDMTALKRLVDRGLFLSEQMESLTESPLGRGAASLALRRASAFHRELRRIEGEWTALSQSNPFMSRDVEAFLRRGEERLQKAVDAGQGVQWVGLHETRQSMMALNTAVSKMMQDMQSMQQQMAQSQDLQQQMQQMISQQQDLNQMMQQLQKMGEKGKEMLQQLQEMAQRQAAIRQEIEKMMRQYRYSKQLRNRLEGIYDEMREVEKLLKDGQNNEEVQNKQKRILTRMLEAGTMQEEDQYGKDRKEETAKTGTEGAQPSGDYAMTLKEKMRRAVDRPLPENIPPQYREALKYLYVRLAEETGR